MSAKLPAGELSNFGSIVVYCNTRAGADGLAAQLQRAAVSARPYHAGMQQPQRDSVQVMATRYRFMPRVSLSSNCAYLRR